MRLVFMGTAEFAVPVLEKLKQHGYDLVAVVTQPDRPSGRGYKVKFSPVKEKALELGLQVWQPARVKDHEFIETLRRLNPDLVVVAAYGQILPREVLEIPRFGCLNVHASLLPQYRGAAPIQRAIMAGEKKTGVTIMLMNEGLDTGGLISQEEVAIPEDFNFGQLHDQLAQVGADLLIKTIPLWQKGEITAQSQADKESSYASPLKKEDEKIYWTNPVEIIYNQIRALTPTPGAFTLFKGKPLKVTESAIYSSDGREKPAGTVLSILKGCGFVVQTGQGSLLVKQVQPVGKKAMPAQSFINGYHLKVGECFDDLP